MMLSNATTLRVVDIVEGTTVDGPGFRTSIYFAGCSHHCPGCHNPHTWDQTTGRAMTISEIMDVVARNRYPVTFSGGDPMLQSEAITKLAKELRKNGYGIWCYTGYTIEQLLDNTRYTQLLQQLDVVVDGRFVESLRDTALLFRGSSNQRLIDVPATLAAGKPIIWESKF